MHKQRREVQLENSEVIVQFEKQGVKWILNISKATKQIFVHKQKTNNKNNCSMYVDKQSQQIHGNL